MFGLTKENKFVIYALQLQLEPTSEFFFDYTLVSRYPALLHTDSLLPTSRRVLNCDRFLAVIAFLRCCAVIYQQNKQTSLYIVNHAACCQVTSPLNHAHNNIGLLIRCIFYLL